MKVSVVLPVFNERENLAPLLDEIDAAMRPTGHDYEIVAVDDGSSDGSRELLRQLAAARPHLKVVLFRRNFGQSAALDAGFRHASGDVIATLDADRQNDPADIPRLLARLGEDVDVVAGWRRERRDPGLRVLASRAANGLVRLATGTRVHDLGCSLRVWRRDVTDEISLFGEMHRFVVVLAETAGARVVELETNHRPRTAGRSKYGLGRALRVPLDLLTVLFLRRFAAKPLHLFGGIGMALLGLSAVLAAWALWEKWERGVWVHNNPLLLVGVLFALVGTQALAVGLLAEILVRTWYASRGRGPYSVAATLNTGPAPER